MIVPETAVWAVYFGKGIATLGVCGLGAWSMSVTGGKTGIGWAILGVLFIWA